MFSEVAYILAQSFIDQVPSTGKKEDSSNKLKLSVWREALDLMRKHPTLQILFIEAIFHQIVGNMLNLMFHDALRLRISDDGLRATVVFNKKKLNQKFPDSLKNFPLRSEDSLLLLIYPLVSYSFLCYLVFYLKPRCPKSLQTYLCSFL